MYLRKLTFMLATLVLLLPTVASANEIDVRSGKVRIIKTNSGQIYVETDRNSVNLPERRYRRRRSPQRSYYYRRQYRSCNSGKTYSQYSRQFSNNNGNRIEQSSIATICR